QNVFFHPTDSTIFYCCWDSGIYITHIKGICPTNRILLKNAINPSYFLILADRPNILFFTANDTLWHSDDNGSTWNVAAETNISDIAHIPNSNIYFGISTNLLSKGLYISRDTGKTFMRLDTIMLYSVAVDTSNGVLYAGGNGILYRSDDSGITLYSY